MPTLVFTPSTEVRLLSGVPLDPSYTLTRDFNNAEDQAAYFSNFNIQAFNDFTYQREGGFIRVPLGYDVAVKANYVMYRNNNYTSKWFYAFVTKVEYISQNVSAVYIETDVIQTWLFDYHIAAAYIERETVASDNLFEHTIPEGLETGPYKIPNFHFWNLGGSAIVVAYIDSTSDDPVGGQLFQGVYSGVKYLWFGVTDAQIEALNNLLNTFSKAGYLDDILGIFMVPYPIIINMELSTTVQSTFSKVDGYTPHNKKLFCYPYRYLALNNCRGVEVTYRYELASNPSAIPFKVLTSFNMKSQCLMYPQNYEGRTDNVDQGIIIDSFPFCSWVGNIYANYVARNAANISMGVINSIMGAVGIMGSDKYIEHPAIGAGKALAGVLSTFANEIDRSRYPYQIQGQVSADVANISWDRVGYEFKQYTITQEYAKMIDQFFDRYGYLVNRNGVPNLKSRQHYNFIKCHDIIITGPMPQQHLELLRTIFKSGITFWHDNTIGNYNQTNPIVNSATTISEEEESFTLTNYGASNTVPDNPGVVK